jgi:hypothetical protein
MKKNLISILFLIVGSWIYAQQSDCIVKMASISGSYVGECKKGLAHGKGSATGTDFYQGEFNKGLPEGKGIYKWANGAYYDGEWKKGMREGHGKYVYGDSIAEGFWKADRFQGKKPTPPYKISAVRNIQRLTITKGIETGNGVKIKLLLGGSDNSEVNDLSLAYTNGSEYRNIGTYGIENINVPLDVTVRYTTWNQLHTVQYDVVLEFTILEPGVWHVTITNM